ncbi:MAG: DUF177 domain-containing protein [Bacteroidetes bacterium]|nr:DUF177 domain-containing protein [Bacteroidota bacterium]
MDYLKDFIVHFVGLSIGNHQFDFEVRDQFFEAFEYSQLQHGNVRVKVDLEKQDRMMVFSFSFDGKVEVLCDRCGEEFMFHLQGEEQLIVKFGEDYKEESEDMIIIPSTEYKIDLSSFIYEYLHLMLPTRIVHPEDEAGNTTCNPDTLRRLAELAPHPVSDPRWAALGILQQEDSNLQDNSLKHLNKKKK